MNWKKETKTSYPDSGPKHKENHILDDGDEFYTEEIL